MIIIKAIDILGNVEVDVDKIVQFTGKEWQPKSLNGSDWYSIIQNVPLSEEFIDSYKDLILQHSGGEGILSDMLLVAYKKHHSVSVQFLQKMVDDGYVSEHVVAWMNAPNTGASVLIQISEERFEKQLGLNPQSSVDILKVHRNYMNSINAALEGTGVHLITGGLKPVKMDVPELPGTVYIMFKYPVVFEGVSSIEARNLVRYAIDDSLLVTTHVDVH
jgi:hypothetical protein